MSLSGNPETLSNTGAPIKITTGKRMFSDTEFELIGENQAKYLLETPPLEVSKWSPPPLVRMHKTTPCSSTLRD
jgi:hypothetical protein